MSKVDEELTRRLRRAERPVDADGLFEGLAKRRSHHERVRRMQVGLLAFAVLAATGGGFVLLRNIFDTDKRHVGDEQTPSVGNGEIVFSRASSEGEHLFLTEPDGTDLRQITHGDTSDRLPAWSPDGNRIVFVRQAESSIRLYVLDIDAGDPRPITPPSMGVYRPSWSPDGELIAFAGVGEDVSDIWVVRPDGSELRRITEGTFFAPDAPRWSPDGSTIAFAANLPDKDGGYREGWDVYLVSRDGSGLHNLTDTPNPERSESPIGWLPNGNLLLSESPGTSHAGPGLPIQMGRWLEVTPSGDLVRTVLEDEVNTQNHLQEPRLSPDGRFAIFDSARGGTQEVWFLDVATLEFTQVTTSGGYSAAWQPIPIRTEPTPTVSPEPSLSPSPSPVPEDSDIGLGFNVCNLAVLSGIDFLGDGTDGTAWTATKVKPNGKCPSTYDGTNGVAVDFTSDGEADSWSETIEHCTMCGPFMARDLNEDGTEEVIITLQGGSIMQYGIYTVMPLDAKLQIVPFTTSEPGHDDAGHTVGEPFTFWVGGDEGSSYWFHCEAVPEFRLTDTYTPVDGGPDTETTVHETHVSLGTDGVAHILDAQTHTVVGEVDLQYATSKPDCGLGVDIRRLEALA
jgi:Tol biopolymer transport system component